MNRLRDLFCPSEKQRIMQYKNLIDLMHRYKGDCCTCKWIIGPDPSLPGFVTDFGSCQKGCSHFAGKVCGLEKIECKDYEYDEDRENDWKNKIQEMELNLPGDYCEHCPYFDPEILSNNFWANGRIVAGEQKMICKNEMLCRHLYAHLEQIKDR